MNLSELNVQSDSLEFAGNLLDRHDFNDTKAPTLLDVTGVYNHGMPTASGLNDYDYQNLSTLSMNLKQLNQLTTVNKVPIPPEVMEHFKHIKCHCMMGLFPEIGRAWLTIDSDIYIWTYEHSRDVAYFDGLNHLIVSVGLVQPKPGVFIGDVKYLLIVTTPVEIVVLGVTFGDTTKLMASPMRSIQNSIPQYEEMQLMNKPIFIINTDNIAITTVEGTADGRVFLGGRDGCLYEICYQAKSNWFGQRCKKVNHSQGFVSYMVPGFLKVFSDTDSISKIVVDNTKRLLYVLTEKGAIEAWDMGEDSSTMKRIARITQNDIAYHAGNVLKTVDASVFKPVTALCPLTDEDCPNLHLLAVTQSGVRFYFSTTPLQIVQQPNTMEPPKPQGLYLLHVRLPPGYTPNATVGKPKQVHTAFYSQGSLLMVSSPQQEQDLLWSLSSEPFPLRRYLAESSTVMPLDGQVWAMAEIKPKFQDNLKTTPLRNAQNPRKVVLLTNQGAHIVALLKPVDLLQQLLMASHGPHNESVKAYFQTQSESQACATSVLLACMESLRGSDLVLWATQAFLLYGGEPTFGQKFLHNQTMQAPIGLNEPGSPRMFMSTPYTSRAASSVQQSLMQQTQYPASPIQNNQNFNIAQPDFSNLTFSPKHTGLYLHLSRLLRPIWKRRCIDNKLYSTITQQDCNVILEDLYALKNFLDTNSVANMSGMLQNYTNQNSIINCSPGRSYGQFNQSSMMGGGGQQRNSNEEAHIEEKRSLDAFTRFIKHTCEVMALWKILCEHQFHLLCGSLPKEQQNILLASTFRELILLRADTCALLIVSLINTYLNDKASVGYISSKLRDVCPSLYRHEDAVSHKATEILLLSKNCTDAEEKDDRLTTALQLCKDAAPNLPLSSICQQFTVAGFYQGVIELCAVCAAKIDPTEAALHFYKNNEPMTDQEGYYAYSARMNCYKEVNLMLEQVYQNLCNANTNIDSNKCGYEMEDREKNINAQILGIVAIALQNTDQLLHNTFYSWLLSHNLLGELLGITEPSLGIFLARSVHKNTDNLGLADLLWKYHERNGQHAAAAKILNNLATMPSNSIPLEKRIDCLAHAVMCMRSDSVGSSTHNGVLLKDLEDKLEISRVQKLILDTMEGNREAVQNLNHTLYNMTQLYSDFADEYDLWECKLTILNCSHHNDPLLIESVWTNILDNELEAPGSPYEKSTRLLSKVQSLAREYGNSGHCFPLAFIVRELEVRCCKLRLEQFSVAEALITMNIEIDSLLDIYSRMISLNERLWATEGSEWHLVQAVARLILILTNQPNLVSARKKPRVVAKAQDLISSCLNLLYPKPDTQNLIEQLRDIQAKLQRVLV